MIVGLGLETGQCYQLDSQTGLNYVFLGGPGLVQISRVPILFFLSKRRALLETDLQATFVQKEQAWNCGPNATFSVHVRKRYNLCSGIITQIYFLEI